jgi:hypothetical protein
MPTQPITPAQAQALAQAFHDIAAAVGNYRIDQALTLRDAQQFQLQNFQSQLLQNSNNFVTMGLFAEQTDIDTTLQTIAKATAAAKAAISTITKVDKILQILAAAAILGASIASMNPSAVGSGIQGLITATITPAGGTTAGSTDAAAGPTETTGGAAAGAGD